MTLPATMPMPPAYFPSPPQGVWHLGPLPIRAYALCIITGIVFALLIGDRRWEARGGERGVIYDIALWAVPFGLVGGRLYHLATDWRTYWGPGGAGFGAALRIWDGGLGIWGAVALGGVGAWIACRRRGIPLPAFGDAVAPGIVLAQAIGRLGNYFNQELYGRETTLPWGLEIFYRRDPSGYVDPHSLDGVSTGQVALVVQPTFLYELIWNLLVFAALIYADRRLVLGHGRLFALYVAAYCIGRFGVELLRDDTATHIAGIRINSFTSTFVFIGAVVYFMSAPKGREDPASLRGNDGDVEVSPVSESAAQAAEGEGAEPQTAAGDVTDDQAVEPEVEAEAAGSEAADFVAADFVAAEPESAAEAMEPDAVEADVDHAEDVEEAEAEVAEAEVAEPEVVEPEVVEPEVVEPEVVEPEVVEPEVAEPEVAEPEAVEPERSEAEVAEAMEPDAVETDVDHAEDAEAAEGAEEVAEPSEAEVAEPEVAEPEVVEGEVAEPEVAEAEVAEAEVAEAEVAEAEVAEAEVAEAEESEPSEPEVAEAEVAEAEVAEAEESEPSEPEVAEAEVAEAEESEPSEPEVAEPEAEESEPSEAPEPEAEPDPDAPETTGSDRAVPAADSDSSPEEISDTGDEKVTRGRWSLRRRNRR